MKDYYTFQNVKAHADQETVTIRTADDGLRRLPVEQISGLHLMAGYSVTDGLVELANNARFPIHFYSFGGHYQGSIDPRPAAPQAAMLVAQLVSIRDPQRRLEVSLAIAQAQRTALGELLVDVGVDEALPPIAGTDVEAVRLSEARMRREFYACFDTALEPFWSILKRERRPPRRPADAVLGFANGICYAKMTGWIYRVGLDPRLGYLHGETRAPNPLALDLAELAKPHLSEAVLHRISETGRERSLVETVGDGTYLNAQGRKAVIQAIEERLRATVPRVDAIWATDLQTALQQVPLRLHKAIITRGPVEFPVIPCTSS